MDLCSILGIDLPQTEAIDLPTAVHLADLHDSDLAAWLRETFSLTWLHDQMHEQLSEI